MATQQTGGRFKAILILGISLAAAVVAVVLVFRMIQVAQQEVAKAREVAEGTDVVVAARDLNVGVPIAAEDVALRRMPREAIPEGVAFTTTTEILERVPRERILANEIVRSERLAVSEAGIGLNALVSPGMRAMSVGVTAVSGVSGFILPGNYVDVIVTIRPDESSGVKSWISRAFLQGVKVLAVGSSLEAVKDKPGAPKAKDKPTVTLELDLQQAEEVALSASKGDIHLVLRNDIDITRVATQGAIASALVGKEVEGAPAPVRPVYAAAPAESKPMSEVIVGGQVQEVRFDQDGSKTITVQKKK
ncbi:MAG: Flp pilus assembly protein CpaB [Deltaproteobacteria bacterium]|nr:Flp pilus assembly protein CpaB [Deltaproteobacteria bacterium]